MSHDLGDLEALIADCKLQARAMFQAATDAVGQEAKAELVALATEWLKLATEIADTLRDI